MDGGMGAAGAGGEALLRALERARLEIGRGKARAGLERLDRAVRGEKRGGIPLDFLAPAVHLAILRERQDLARRWIARACGKPAAGFEDRAVEIRLLRLLVAVSTEGPVGRREEIEAAFAAVRRWRPWMAAFRWAVLVNTQRFAELDAFLRRPPLRIPDDTPEYGMRLVALGIRHFSARRYGPAGTVLQSALRKLDLLDEPEAVHVRALALTWIARISCEEYRFRAARAWLLEAEDIARRDTSRGIRWLIATVRSLIHYRCGEYEEAIRSNLEMALAPSRPSTPYHRAYSALAVLNAARCALKLGRAAQAARLLARAAAQVRRLAFPSLRGYLELLRGDLEREKGTREGFRAARARYRAAEAVFARKGAENHWYLGQVHLSRAALHLREKDYAGALREAVRGMEVAARNGSLDIQSEGLLLQSHFLLEKNAPRLEVYEGLLRKLGLIRDPVILFKVLANLYLYSWDLADHLDLTDLHLKQILSLRGVLPADAFDRLYRVHVTDRVLKRFRSRFDLPGGEDHLAGTV